MQGLFFRFGLSQIGLYSLQILLQREGRGLLQILQVFGEHVPHRGYPAVFHQDEGIGREEMAALAQKEEVGRPTNS